MHTSDGLVIIDIMSEQVLTPEEEMQAVKLVVDEYVSRKSAIEAEIETLKDDLKQLKTDFEEKVDMKTLEAVLKVRKIEQKVQHKHMYDMISEALESKV